VKDVGVIVVTSDKGLCGGLNTNALRLTLNKVKELQGEGRKVNITALGNKGFSFMQRFRANIVSHVTALGDVPHMDRLVGPVKVQVDAFATRRRVRPQSDEFLGVAREIAGFMLLRESRARHERARQAKSNRFPPVHEALSGILRDACAAMAARQG